MKKKGHAIVDFLAAWWGTRDRLLMLWGLPALGCGVGLLVLIALAETRSATERSHRYLTAARRAHHDQRMDAASIFYKKVLADRPDDLEVLLEAAVVANATGEETRRDAVLNRLVKEGYAPGMLFKGTLALTNGVTKASLVEAEGLLSQAMAAMDGEMQLEGALDRLRRALAGGWRRLGDLEKSIEFSEQVGMPMADDRVMLAMAYLLKGDREKGAAVGNDELIRSAGPLGAAFSLAFQGNEEGVRQQLELARRLAKDSSGLRAWAETSVRCFHVLALESDLAPSLRVIEPVSTHAPGLPALAGALISLAGLSGGLEGIPAMDRRLVTQALAGGGASATGHVVAGLRNLDEGSVAEGKVHFSIAKGIVPQVGLTLTQCGLVQASAGKDASALARSLGELGLELSDAHEVAVIGHAKILLRAQGVDSAVEWLEQRSGGGGAVARFLEQLQRLKS